MKHFYLIALFLFSGITAAYAQDSDQTVETKSTRFMIEMTASFGGGELGLIEFTNGTDQSIKAGNGLTFSAGIDQQITGTSFGVKAMAGYKYSGSMASNANVMKTAIPLDVIPYYAYKNHRVGPAFHYHINPSIDWDTLGPKDTYKNAFGAGLEYMYIFNNLQFAANYTVMNYQYEDIITVNNNHFSVKIGYLFN